MGAQLSGRMPVQNIAQFTPTSDFASILSLNSELAKRMGVFRFKTKTSVMNESEINNIIDTNPLLGTLYITIDGRPLRTSRENMGSVKFSHLTHIIFASDAFDHSGTGLDLKWLAHKLDNRSIHTVDTIRVDASEDNRAIHTFTRELLAINTLIIRWDHLEWLLLQSDDMRRILDTITDMQLTITTGTRIINQNVFVWLHGWAKSETHERKLSVTINMYDLTIHNAITDAFQYIDVQFVCLANRGLVSLQLDVQNIDNTVFRHDGGFLNVPMVWAGGRFWGQLCKNTADVNITVDTRFIHEFLLLNWFESMITGYEHNGNLSVHLVLRSNMRDHDEFSRMFTPFEQFINYVASYMMIGVHLVQFRDMESTLMDRSIKEFVDVHNFAIKLHVSFVCPNSRIPNIKEKILANVAAKMIATEEKTELVIQKHLILSERISITQTHPIVLQLPQTLSTKRKLVHSN